MPIFKYKGFDSVGRKVNGSCEGSGQHAVTTSLRQQGIFPTELIATGTHLKPSLVQQLRAARIPIEDLAIATRQLSTLLAAGLSLDAALNTVAGQVEKPQLAEALKRIREAVVQGEALHLALANLADLLEEQARLRSRITAALAYPLLMAIVGTGVLLFLVGYVLPKVTRMLLELDQVLPLPTRILIAASNLLQDYGWLLGCLLIIALLVARRWTSGDAGRLTIDRWRLKLPIVGRLNLLIATTRFSRTLSTLLGSGLPLLRALEITGKLLNNRLLQQAIESAGRQVREGSSLATPLQKSGLFPTMLMQMIAIGEKSGELEQMLSRVADTSDQQIELSINRLLALLEPVMILLMGGAVGFIVLAILLPIFQASQSLG